MNEVVSEGFEQFGVIILWCSSYSLLVRRLSDLVVACYCLRRGLEGVWVSLGVFSSSVMQWVGASR